MNNLRQYINDSLVNLYPETEIRSFYFWIMESLTGASRTNILANKYTHLSETQIDEFKTIVSRLAKFEPIQYVLGETSFFDLRFKLQAGVLIPRPETEELVDWILQDSKSLSALRVLDIGTGSGCIAISLAANLKQAQVQAFDISPVVLAVAKANAVLNEVEVDFCLVDILSEENSTCALSQYDVIVSNPPYVCEREKADMEPNVLLYEPALALFVSDSDPLLFYKRIASFAAERLVPGGKLYFEINQAYGLEMISMLSSCEFVNIELRKDIFGKDRMIKAEKQ